MVKFKDSSRPKVECFSSTFRGKFNFQGLSKTVMYIQVLFKSVRTLSYEDQIKVFFLPLANFFLSC